MLDQRANYRYLPIFLFMLALACESKEAKIDPLFQSLTPEQTGVTFENKLRFDERFNVFQYRNYYNGGGVGIGDINNDGWEDIYLSANDGPNHLYLNKGNMQFEEVGEQAGVTGNRGWATGVAMVDVNADGWLDIYVCNSGNIQGDDKQNELFINNQDGTFTEKAAEFGLADEGYGTHAVFFDYDKDGDLDCYLLNNSFRPIDSFGTRNLRGERDALGGDKLFRNDGSKFTDVSEEAGILGSVIGFGLGVTVGDVNGDLWQDIYISNDFFERDYLYINNQDGTFSEKLTEAMGHISLSSMGADMADLNNDGHSEIFVTDMLPPDDERLKQTSTYESYNVFNSKLKQNYYHQYMRNTLHWNHGDGSFSEIAQLAGVHATDWSWGALLADFDNDGLRDIFVCNGIYKDVTDQDFINYLAANETMQAALQGERVNFKDFVERMPSTPIPNHMFKNKGDFQFEEVTDFWGLQNPGFSNGAAYADLDQDGDLDLVINNVNAPASLYQNTTADKNKGSSVIFSLSGKDKNPFALGTVVNVYDGKERLSYYEHMPMRGFQSSMGYHIVLGVGNRREVDVELLWPDGVRSFYSNIPTDTLLYIDMADASANESSIASDENEAFFERISKNSLPAHQENNFVDFNSSHLVYRMRSRGGPAFAYNPSTNVAYLGGATRMAPQLFEINDGRLIPLADRGFDTESEFEDTDALFFDADGDADLDLYVCSGGSEHRPNAPALTDRLYINEKGSFSRSSDRVPYIYAASSSVVAFDLEGDGDLDLMVGSDFNTRTPWMPAPLRVLENDGKGYFQEITHKFSSFENFGLVNELKSADLNADGMDEIIVAADWQEPMVLWNRNGQFELSSVAKGKQGWWQHAHLADLDGDGDLDIIWGNWGLNTKFKPDSLSPVRRYVGDIDGNRTIDPIYTFVNDQGVEKPYALRYDIVKQLNYLSKKFTYYREYREAAITDLFTREELNSLHQDQLTYLQHGISWNEGDGKWSWQSLPRMTQISPLFASYIEDFNKDGKLDILIAGNFDGTKPEEGRYDASYGQLLLQGENRNFELVSKQKAGLELKGNIRHIMKLDNELLFVKNNGSMEAYKQINTP